LILCSAFLTSDYVQAQNQTSNNIVVTIPIGDAGIHYANVGLPNSLVWGPASLTMDEQDNFWITDTVEGQILQYYKSGTQNS
jgi:hypothetical protein